MSVYRIKGSSGTVINQAWSLQAHLDIGGADCQDVALQDLPGDSVVARLSVADGAVWLKSLDPGCPVYLNGEAVAEASLGSGDEIRVGTARFILQAPGLKPERVLEPGAVATGRRWWPWVAVAALAAAAAVLAWQQGWVVL